jgi:ubiquinone/menaquinone biosynthesis C-methylase UbiE
MQPATDESRKTEKQSEVARFSSIADPNADAHVNGEYFKKHPTWHVEYSEWKARNIYDFLRRKGLQPRTVGEVGCGAGEVLRQLQTRLAPECTFRGYDIAPPAIEMANTRSNERLQFELADFGEIETPRFDLLLILETVDHVEDYLGFLRMLKPRADLKIFSFSLDISAVNVVRKGALLRQRVNHSHLHQFSKDTALEALKYTGYQVLDAFYPAPMAPTASAKVANLIRKTAFLFGEDFAVRIFGGHSLLVLAC